MKARQPNLLGKFFRILKPGRKKRAYDDEVGVSNSVYGNLCNDVDPNFYRSYYKDLMHLDAWSLQAHYVKFGMKEGRFPTYSAFIAHMESLYGRLPEEFDAMQYKYAYEDLRRLELSDAAAAEHYLRYGRKEGRLPFKFDLELYRELYFRDQAVDDKFLTDDFLSFGRENGRIGCGRALLSSKGVTGDGTWVDLLKIDEFKLLNFEWVGADLSKSEAVDYMLADGITRLAPIAFSLQFDPAFYREILPEHALKDDMECYRHWLFFGLGKGVPGSVSQFFATTGIPLKEYPSAFLWRRYLSENRISGTKWFALEHFVVQGFRNGSRPVEGYEAGRFYTALGDHFAGKNEKLAIDAFQRAGEFGGLCGSARRRLADCYYRRGEWLEALEDYSNSIRDGVTPDVTSITNAAKAAIELKKTDLAFSLLKEGRDYVGGEPEWRHVLHSAIEEEFGIASSKAKTLLLSGERALADEVIAAAIQRTTERFATFDPLGVPLEMESSPRIVILANVDLSQCTRYRVEQKQLFSRHMSIDCEMFPASDVKRFVASLPGAAAAIFFRLPAFPMNIRAIEVARALGVPTYYDIDDLIFDSNEYPEPRETYSDDITDEFYMMLQFGAPLFRGAMALCDYGIASTTALAGYMEKVVRKHQCFVLPNGLDETIMPYFSARPAKVRHDDKLVIFYGSGTKAHNSDFLTLVGPALRNIMTRHPNVSLMIVGHLALDESFDLFKSRIYRISWVNNINGYLSILAEADINIAVLDSHATTDCKSEIKWLEAAALGIPSIVSGTARYREVLRDRTDALIANDAREWEEAIETLVTSPATRARLVEAARSKAIDEYSIGVNAERLIHILNIRQERESELIKSRRLFGKRAASTKSRRKRILLVNLFFYPQVLGGSARVVQGNLDRFLDRSEEHDFEFAVATTDFNNRADDIEWRVETYRGCPVFRIVPPQTPNIDWEPNLPKMGEAFRKIIDIWKPDLVHFNCIQRFSGSVVEACIEAAVPYIVSLHDAWWISDWHFLSDGRGRLRTPGEALPFNPPGDASIGDALARRRYLASLLNRAQEVLAVSESFAETYRSCGFPRTRALPNGVPMLELGAHTTSRTGRVRLAHVGSMTMFKGFFLIEAALRQSAFENLELTVVDHSRYGGPEEHTVWGGTPVKIVGKSVAEKMHLFYENFDVLLAPSLWPEPFGLVTREALAAGLWVLASDRGAIGEDVTPGLNGWVINVDTPKELLEILARIDVDTTTYLRPPPTVALLTSHGQADRLRELYGSILGSAPLREKPNSSMLWRERNTPAENGVAHAGKTYRSLVSGVPMISSIWRRDQPV